MATKDKIGLVAQPLRDGCAEVNCHLPKLRSEGHPAPLLKIVEAWLRKEVAEKDQAGITEKASGDAALGMDDPNAEPTNRGGGYNPGRMLSHYA